MALNINGTTGISGVDGSVSAPALTGTDSNTGITFPSADTIKFSTGGVERMSITNSGITNVGKILQVVSAQKTDTFSSSATSQIITVSGLTINITPSSSSNKVFICFNMNIGHSGTGSGIGGKIFRSSDSQNILRAPADGSRTRSYLAQFTCHSNTNNTTRFVSPCFLDSPSSTNQVSYTFQVYNSSGTVFINRSGEDIDNQANPRGCSFAYAMEVAA